MESNYSNRDFERYVKQNSDQYRMFPSEKVWKGVHNALHTRRRWYGWGLALLLLITGGAVTLVMKSYPVSKKQDLTAINTGTASTNNNPESPATKKQPEDIREVLSFERQSVSVTAVPTPVAIAEYTPAAPWLDKESFVITDPITAQKGFNEQPTAPSVIEQELNTIINRIPVFENVVAAPVESLVIANHPAETPVSTETKPVIEKKKAVAQVSEDGWPYSIENVTNLYKAPPRRVSWQVFVTPTVSYRKLGENNSFAGANSTSIYPFASVDDINNAVTHKPDLGMQVGLMARYPITKNFRVRAGAQFNMNRYDIKAFAYPAEVAVISLDGDNTTAVSAWSQYRSQNGYKSDWLKNVYLSVSLPVGVELTLFGNRKTSVGVATTIQPTYVIRDRAYLISTDLKNYAKVPWLIRHVNMSTGFEAFVNYKTGKHQWQIGPQVRYQLLSSFQNKYPVKENLFDFGVRVGLTLNP